MQAAAHGCKYSYSPRKSPGSLLRRVQVKDAADSDRDAIP
jgi:hypothetical protein